MNEKTVQVLELPKILAQIVTHSQFSAGADLIRQLRPSTDLREATDWQQETTEARVLLDARSDITMGGARDVREAAVSATRGIILDAQTFLDIRGTLRRGTTLKRIVGKQGTTSPRLADIANGLEECNALQGEISQTIDDNGGIYDNASPKLALIRRDMRVAFERLQSRLNNLINNTNNAKFLQEQLITQRNGRYVIPLRAEFKGRIPGIVHDSSSSGATLFIEPMATVELNNSLRELEIEEENEIRRILRALSEEVGKLSEQIVRTVEGLAHLDLIFAKARYASAINATAPQLLPFRSMSTPHPGSRIKLESARHPLLDPRKVVPIDMVLDDETFILVITGPNTGGKTVALKTVGLLTLMAQAGLHIPAADGAELTIFEGIYADIGDEQSIEQSLSTFSAHMTNTINILRECNERSLVILDELGAGTDPTEGSALARAVLNSLVERKVTTLVTTHHPELKIYSQNKFGVRNASVEFDLETLRPTYHLVIGIPGRSNALSIATRLGLPTDIITDARSMVGVEDLVADNLLDELHKSREEARRARDAAVAQQAAVEELKRELRERLDAVEIERRDVIAQTRRMADREIDELRSEVRKLRHNLQAAGQPLEVIKRIEEAAFTLKSNIQQPVENVTQPPADVQGPQFRIGDTVWVIPLKAEGEIAELTPTEAEVIIGRLRVRVKLDEIEKRNREESRRASRSQGKPAAAVEERDAPRRLGQSPGLELDLRGERVEEALERIEGYLDAAYMAGLPFVRIIHGKGTGALRQAVRDVLRNNPLVQKYERGGEREGGDGVTVVNLVPLK
ncbi:MAG: endonuclease MutS2 [Anaerolineae bacterium]|nr:endonuclease MutS2 [Anaerolineae bacterium]